MGYPRLGGFPWASSGLGRHQIRVEYDQPFEVKNHGLQEGRELILRHPAVAHPLGCVSVERGQRVTWLDEAVKKLLQQIPEKIRVIGDEPTQLRSGVWVEFFSPLFGMCTARIQVVTVDGCVITNHSVLKGEGEPVTISASWICGVYREQWAS